MALRSPRTKRSKTEVEQEFSAIAEQAANEKSGSSLKNEALSQMQEAEVRAAVSEITVEVIAKKLSDLNVEISRTLSGLGEKMNGEVGLLRSLKEAVALESKELHQLHGIDIAATSIDQLVVDYQEKKASFEKDLLNARQEWAMETEEKKQQEAEYTETLKKNRSREIEDYEYIKALERKKLQDRFDEEYRLKEKQNREAQENLEKSWKEREAALKGREEELAALKKEVEQFQGRLVAECSKAAKEATKETEAKYNQEIERLKRDLLVEKQIGELKLKQQQESLANQQTQMTSLQAQLDEAKRQVQDIAIKAIEGASGAKALSQINQIAMEQAKNRMPN
ncbi:MAG: Myosin heavy chain [Parachlamydiales bacterium]|nr:Myosin heavy chain [Parachlamydiales bacterium]